MNFILRYMKCRKQPVEFFRSLGVKIGNNCHFYGPHPDMFGSEPFLIEIGDNVFVTNGVRFVTHDGGMLILRHKHPKIDVLAPIRIGSYVFIGTNSIIMPGVTIGDNVVVGAGSVVTRDIESGSVCVGVPAKRIKSIEEYESQALQKSLETYKMSAEEKRAFLIERWMKSGPKAEPD